MQKEDCSSPLFFLSPMTVDQTIKWGSMASTQQGVRTYLSLFIYHMGFSMDGVFLPLELLGNMSQLVPYPLGVYQHLNILL